MIIEIEYTSVFLASDCGLLDRETTEPPVRVHADEFLFHSADFLPPT